MTFMSYVSRESKPTTYPCIICLTIKEAYKPCPGCKRLFTEYTKANEGHKEMTHEVHQESPSLEDNSLDR